MSGSWLPATLILVAAYLLGSVPFSLLVARRFGVADVRKVGSGNVGATNVLRSAGRLAGAIALTLDAGKGAAAVLLARALAPGIALEAQAATAAILGHVFPVWLRFRGGKGVATGVGAFAPLIPWAAAGGVAGVGAFAPLIPWAAAAGLAAFASVLWLTRYVAVASICGGFALAVAAWLLGAGPAVAVATTAVALLIVWTHRSNLRRLAAGSEARLGAKSRS